MDGWKTLELGDSRVLGDSMDTNGGGTALRSWEEGWGRQERERTPGVKTA